MGVNIEQLADEWKREQADLCREAERQAAEVDDCAVCREAAAGDDVVYRSQHVTHVYRMLLGAALHERRLRDEAAGREALFEQLLPALDDLHRAHAVVRDIAKSKKRSAVAGFADGLNMIIVKIVLGLAARGIERVPVLGRVFDPALHEAVEHVESEEPAGVVVREEAPGYAIGGRLIRAARVAVSRGPANGEEVPQ